MVYSLHCSCGYYFIKVTLDNHYFKQKVEFIREPLTGTKATHPPSAKCSKCAVSLEIVPFTHLFFLLIL